MSYNDIKKLFEKEKNIDVLSNEDVNTITEDLESLEYVTERNISKNRYVPNIEYDKPEKFAFYGSAEEYYDKSFAYIRKTYPYDGSLKEKQQWHNEASDLDNFIFDKKYPRKTGFVNFSSPGWGTRANTITETDFNTSYWGGNAEISEPSIKEYILIKGGPNADPNGDIKFEDSEANIFNSGSLRGSNLEVDFNRGVTVEFWYKNASKSWPLSSSATSTPVVFDLWNGVTGSSRSYGRLTLFFQNFVNSTNDGAFFVNCVSGSGLYMRGFNATSSVYENAKAFTQLPTSSVLDGNWHHYAFTFVNSNNDLHISAYMDGTFKQTLTASGQAMNPITVDGAASTTGMIAAIGSSVAHPWITSLTDPGTITSPNGQGWNKISGSIDEFRFWKIKRTSKQIGRSWFNQVGGGTNSDISNVELGIYYKFNEGITHRVSDDKVILDYSGRISNGNFVGYNTQYNQRDEGSAINESGYIEFEDPVIYIDVPDYHDRLRDLKLSGSLWDRQNATSIRAHFPEWILSDDNDSDGNLKNITQIMSSYLDQLSTMIQKLPTLKNVEYLSGSFKPAPFADKKLSSMGFMTYDLFRDAEKIEKYLDRSESENYSEKIHNIKNFIYDNIYNNLSSIYKAKGNQKSFRQMLHTLGLDEDLFKINLYASNITYEINNDFKYLTRKRKVLDFSRKENYAASVFQAQDPADSNSLSYISGSIPPSELSVDTGMIPVGPLYEANVLFAKEQSPADPPHRQFTEISSSIFGVHTHQKNQAANVLTWDLSDPANFQVFAVRDQVGSSKAKFVLAGTDGSVYSSANLESEFYEVYDNDKWNLSVTIRPTNLDTADLFIVTSSAAHNADQNYQIEFRGFNANSDIIENSFILSSSITTQAGLSALTSSTRLFVGAHKTNFTGSTVNRSDARIINARVWSKYLDDEVLRQHAIDIENHGVLNPLRNISVTDRNKNNASSTDLGTFVPNKDSLSLHWEFSNLTGSDASGEFIVQDVTSGSSSRYGEVNGMGNVLYRSHTGKGIGFAASSANIFDVDYIPVAAQRLPEILSSVDMIKVLEQDDEFFPSSRTLPIRYLLAIEKSMYQTISEEMIKTLATVREFNNLIGQPVNRYRQEYKSLEKMRQAFFQNIGNTPDIEKYINFYKWFDTSVNRIIEQLIPASSYQLSGHGNTIESHVFERNKYWNKFPTVENRSPDIEGILLGINEMLYDYDCGHAPLDQDNQNESCVWWKDRAERTGEVLSSGNSAIDSNKEIIKNVATTVISASSPTLLTAGGTKYQGSNYVVRNLSKPFKFDISKSLILQAGPNNLSHNNTQKDYIYSLVREFSASLNYIRIPSDNPGTASYCECDPEILMGSYKTPLKRKLYGEPHGANGGIDRFQNGVKVDYESQQADLNLPFNLYSGSVANGYKVAFSIPEALDITNLHHDVYGSDSEIPMQGPFTQQNVGGTQHRHQAINNNLTDTAQNRAEAWSLQASPGNEFRLIQPSARPSHTASNEDFIDASAARGYYRRDNTAKSPVNIKNIKMTAGAVDEEGTAAALLSPLYTGRSEQAAGSHSRLLGTIGNYRNNYEVVQSTGRDVNNLLWKDRNQYFADDFTNGDIEDQFAISTHISGIVDHHLFGHNVFYGPFNQQDRNTVVAALNTNASTADLSSITKGVKNRTIFNERFAAPGGPEVMSRGAMDGKSSTYSVYNSMNYRNTTVRDALNVLWTVHSDQFGTASIPTASVAYGNGNATPSYHKINRNTLRRLELTNETADLTNQIGNGISTIEHDDNRWVSHEIPRSDFQYSWITASAESTVRNAAQHHGHYLVERASGHAPKDGFVSGSIAAGYTGPARTSPRRPAITFLSASASGMRVGAFLLGAGGSGGAGTEYVADRAHSFTSSFGNTRREQGFFPHPFVRLNMIIAEPVSTSSTESRTVADGTTHNFIYKNLTGFAQRDNILDIRTEDIDVAVYKEMMPLSPSYFNTINFGRPGHFTELGGGNPFWPVSVFWPGIPGHDASGLPSSLAGHPGGGMLFNGLMLERNGPYGYSSFKQIRAGETTLNRFFRRENIISFIKEGKKFNTLASQEQSAFWSQEIGGQQTPTQIFKFLSETKNISKRERVLENVFEPPLVDRYKPFRHFLRVKNKTSNTGVKDVVLKYTHGNNQSSFANLSLNQSLGTFNQTPQLFDDLKRYYQNSFVPDKVNPLDKTLGDNGMHRLEYTECIYPKEKYTFLKKNRMRTNFDTGFWRDARVCEYNLISSAPSWYVVFGAKLTYAYDKIVFGRTEYNYSGSDGYDNVGGVEPNNGLFARTNSLGAVVTIHSGGEGIVPNANSSIWPLDARAQFTRTDGRDSIIVGEDPSQIAGGDASALSAAVGNQTAFTPYQRIGKGFSGLDGAGELQNDYCIFHNGDLFQSGMGDTSTSTAFTHLSGTNGQTAGLRAACLYNRRVPDVTPESKIMYSGDTYWDAGRQADLEFVIDRQGNKKCIGPFYDTYDDWTEDLNAAGQGYTIIPEYRMSEYIDDYLNAGAFPTKLSDEPDNWLTLTGALLGDISVRNSTALHEDFVDVYTTTDFLKYFQILEKEHLGTHYPSRITLSCKTLKKFLPYDGFYPATRTLQLATLFSQSYGDQIEIEGEQGNFRTITTPLFAPGILYNTIKSGIAVDYPVMVSGDFVVTGTADTPDGGTPRILRLTDNNGNRKYEFDARLPFETIIQPAKFFKQIDGKVFDSEPHPSASINSTASLGLANDSTDPRYNLAMNNFLASTVEFFMEDSRLKTFISDPATAWPEFKSKALYRMVVSLHSSEKDNAAAFDNQVNTYVASKGYHLGGPFSLNIGKNDTVAEAHNTDNFPNRIVMYERFGHGRSAENKHDFFGSSFGPPIAMWDSESTSSYSLYPGHLDTDYFNIPGNSYSASYAPYTPPYYNGVATAIIDFFPPSEIAAGQYNVEDIIQNSRFTFLRECDSPWMTHDWGQNEFELTWASGSNSLAAKGAMPISASIDLNGKAIGFRSAVLDQLGNLEGFGTFEDPSSAESWVISPKFECPTFDFSSQDSTTITMPSSGSGAVAKGLWHQYSADSGGKFTIAQDGTKSLSSAIELSLLPPTLTTSNFSFLSDELKQAKYTNPATGEVVEEVIDLAEHIGMKLDSRIDSNLVQAYKDLYEAAANNNDNPSQDYSVLQAKNTILAQIRDRQERTAQLGQMASSKTIHEAILAIPFTTDTDGQMNFYTFPKEWVQYSLTKDLSKLTNLNPITGELVVPSETVIDQVNKLKKYVLPPHLDFMSNTSITPYVMYIFEYSHTLTKEDLGLIWQNLPPRSLMDIPEPKLSVSTIDHNLFINDFFGLGAYGGKFNFPKTDIRWMVFKVKQRALKDYASITPKTTDEPEYRPWEAIKGADPSINSYGYNWPYDFFSMIELVKMSAGISFTPGERRNETSQVAVSVDAAAVADNTGYDPGPNITRASEREINQGSDDVFVTFTPGTSTTSGQPTPDDPIRRSEDTGQDPDNQNIGANIVINTIQNNNRDV